MLNLVFRNFSLLLFINYLFGLRELFYICEYEYLVLCDLYMYRNNGIEWCMEVVIYK